eukprot:5359777-Amphidinium_carterae.1
MRCKNLIAARSTCYRFACPTFPLKYNLYRHGPSTAKRISISASISELQIFASHCVTRDMTLLLLSDAVVVIIVSGFAMIAVMTITIYGLWTQIGNATLQ